MEQGCKQVILSRLNISSDLNTPIMSFNTLLIFSATPANLQYELFKYLKGDGHCGGLPRLVDDPRDGVGFVFYH